jgi:hypothetical protein
MWIFSRFFKSKNQCLSVQQLIQICEVIEIVNLICKRKHRLYELGVVDLSFDGKMIEKSTIEKFYKEGLLDVLGESNVFKGYGKHKKKLLEIVNNGVNEENIFTIHYIDSFLKQMKRHLYCAINNINIDDLYNSDFNKITTKEILEGFKVEK